MQKIIDALDASKEWHILVHLDPGERVRVLPSPLWNAERDHAIWTRSFEAASVSIELALAARGIDPATSPFGGNGNRRNVPTGIETALLAERLGKLIVLYRLHGDAYHGYTLLRQFAALPVVTAA